MASKREITRRVYEKLEGTTLMDVTLIINTFLETIEESLVEGENVTMVNFGSFNVVDRAERCCADPNTGERMIVPAYKAIVFKGSQKMKDVVNHRNIKSSEENA